MEQLMVQRSVRFEWRRVLCGEGGLTEATVRRGDSQVMAGMSETAHGRFGGGASLVKYSLNLGAQKGWFPSREPWRCSTGILALPAL